MLKDFKPALFFLAKFLAIYFVGNILYGVYVESCGNSADAITKSVTVQTVKLLNLLDPSISTEVNQNEPTVFIKKGTSTVINVFEGCNGINVMIVFVAFLIAFGGPKKKLIWFLLFGLLIIHLTNLVRLCLLYYVAQHYEHYFYYVHKYFFTAILYLIVFALWVIWVVKFNIKPIGSSRQHDE